MHDLCFFAWRQAIRSDRSTAALLTDAVAHQALLSRCFLVGLLVKRNDVLARSIKDACAEADPGATVVAILGAAHLNGVQSRLLSRAPLEGVVPGVKADEVDLTAV